jgi:hypothetical protein
VQAIHVCLTARGLRGSYCPCWPPSASQRSQPSIYGGIVHHYVLGWVASTHRALVFLSFTLRTDPQRPSRLGNVAFVASLTDGTKGVYLSSRRQSSPSPPSTIPSGASARAAINDGQTALFVGDLQPMGRGPFTHTRDGQIDAVITSAGDSPFSDPAAGATAAQPRRRRPCSPGRPRAGDGSRPTASALAAAAAGGCSTADGCRPEAAPWTNSKPSRHTAKAAAISGRRARNSCRSGFRSASRAARYSWTAAIIRASSRDAVDCAGPPCREADCFDAWTPLSLHDPPPSELRNRARARTHSFSTLSTVRPMRRAISRKLSPSRRSRANTAAGILDFCARGTERNGREHLTAGEPSLADEGVQRPGLGVGQPG